ncbi:MAG: flavodoxin domain-containing protein [Desulfobulbaceae bacterium]|nr:flavodoxin domain-containing protein [Desulfobulbaceae bacterium]
MGAVEIKKDIFWVGAVDWNVRDFHGYSTDKGTTYNAYLIKDEKVALFDTVKHNLKSDLVHNIHQVVEPGKIDYIIVNHVEMDHSGSLPDIIDLVKPEKVFCSANGKRALLSHFHREDWPYEVVKTGDEISLGTRTVRFIETKMLHWPDSMFSYVNEEKLLISSDAFGQHLASSERFDDQLPLSELMVHAAKYYANILLVFAPLVQKLLASVAEMGLEIDMIAPDHGPIWRTAPDQIIAAYDRWSRQEARNKAVVVYDTMWHSTEKMAKAVCAGLEKEGVEVRLMCARLCHRSDIIAELLDAKAVICGSATLNNNIMPRMADILTYMKGLRPKGKLGAAFGSYGWSGEAVKHLGEAMTEIGIDLVHEGVRVKNVPDHDGYKECVALGSAVGRAVRQAG